MLRKETLIIVDRDPSRRAILSRDLTNASYHAEPCECLSEYAPDLPEIAIILVHDEGEALAETVGSIRRRRAWLPIIAYMTEPKPSDVVDALNKGAIDYLAWPIEVNSLGKRLGELRIRFAAHFEARTREVRAQRMLEALSRRERQVLDAIVDGNTNKMIAKELSISHRTVEIHRRNAIQKIGANSTAEAVKILMEGATAADIDRRPSSS